MENKTPTRRYLKLKAAADYLGMSAWKLRKLIADGEIAFIQDSEHAPFMLDVFDLDSYMNKYKTTKTS